MESLFREYEVKIMGKNQKFKMKRHKNVIECQNFWMEIQNFVIKGQNFEKKLKLKDTKATF